MEYSEFLGSLYESGRVTVPPFGEVAADDVARGDDVLRHAESVIRQEMPGQAPSFDIDAARWAAIQLFRACQFTVYRDLPADLIAKVMNTPCPNANQPSTHYSVDTVLRFLPDLIRFAKTASSDDPLVEALRQLASDWPLSSVSIADVTPRYVDVIVGNECLLQEYVDRVLEASDKSRLENSQVFQAVGRSTGYLS